MGKRLSILVGLFLYTGFFTSQVSADLDKSASLSLTDLFEIKLKSVSYFDVTVDKAPGTVWLLTAEDLKASPGKNLEDLMQMHIPGVHMGNHAFTGTLYGTRGILIDHNGKTQLMMDEWNMNMRTHFGYMGGGWRTSLLGDVDRIEVIVGPGALKHGSGAMNGSVNLVSKTGENNPGLFANLDGSFPNKNAKAEASFGMKYGDNRDFYIYGGTLYGTGISSHSLSAADSYAVKLRAKKPAEATGVFDALENAAVGGFPSLNYKVAGNWRHQSGIVTFKMNGIMQKDAYYQNAVAGLRDAIPIDGYAFQTHTGLRPQIDVSLLENKLSFEFQPSFLLLNYGITRNDSAAVGGKGTDPKNTKLFIDIIGGSEELYRAHLVSRYMHSDLFNISLGGMFARRNFNGTEPVFPYSDETWGNYETAVGAWDEIGIFTEVTGKAGDFLWNAGLRYDQVNPKEIKEFRVIDELTKDSIWYYGTPKSFGNISPRVALSYSLNESNTIKGSYQKGFRSPDAKSYTYFAKNQTRLRQYDSLRGTPNASNYEPVLDPEVMHSFDVNYLGYFSDIGLRPSVNLFYNIFKKMIFWSPNPIPITEGLTQAQKDDLLNGPYRWTNATDTSFVHIDNADSARFKTFGGANKYFINTPETFYSIGGDFNVTYTPPMLKGFEADLSYSISFPLGLDSATGALIGLTSPDDDRSWARFPRHLVKLSLTQKLLEDRLCLQLTPYGETRVPVYVDTTLNKKFYGKKSGLYDNNRFILNGAVSFQVIKQMNVKLGGTNLLGWLDITNGEVPPIGYVFLGTPASDGAWGWEVPKGYFNVTVNF